MTPDLQDPRRAVNVQAIDGTEKNKNRSVAPESTPLRNVMYFARSMAPPTMNSDFDVQPAVFCLFVFSSFHGARDFFVRSD